MWSGNLFQALFNFQRILFIKESEEVCLLISINFDIFAIRLKKYAFGVTCSKKLGSVGR